MSVNLITSIVNEVPSVNCIKLESLPSPARIQAVQKGIDATRDVSILTGLGALCVEPPLRSSSSTISTLFTDLRS